MGKIQRFTTQGQATSVPMPTVSPEAMSRGAGELGRTLQVASNAVHEFADSVWKAERNAKLLHAENQWQEGVNKFFSSLDADTDYHTYNSRFNEYVGKLNEEISQNIDPHDAAVWNNFVERQKVIHDYALKRKANQGIIKQLEAGFFEDIEAAAQRGDSDYVERASDVASKSGYVDPVVAEKTKEQALEKIRYNDAWVAALDADTREEALKRIKDAELPVAEKNALIAAYDREATYKAAQATLAKEKEIAKTQDDFVSRLYDDKNPLKPEEVTHSNLPPVGGGSKAFFQRLVRARDQAILEGKKVPKATTDPNFLGKMLTELEDPTKPPLTPSEILDKVGHGLSLPDATWLIKSYSTVKSEVFQNTEHFLKVAFGYEGVLKGFGGKAYGGALYNNAMTDILSELAKTPLKGTELKQRMYEVAKPYLEQYWQMSMTSQDEQDKFLKAMDVQRSIPVRKPTQTPKPVKKFDPATGKWVTP